MVIADNVAFDGCPKMNSFDPDNRYRDEETKIWGNMQAAESAGALADAPVAPAPNYELQSRWQIGSCQAATGTVLPITPGHQEKTRS
jgi:hypothetical protein